MLIFCISSIWPSAILPQPTMPIFKIIVISYLFSFHLMTPYYRSTVPTPSEPSQASRHPITLANPLVGGGNQADLSREPWNRFRSILRSFVPKCDVGEPNLTLVSQVVLATQDRPELD